MDIVTASDAIALFKLDQHLLHYSTGDQFWSGLYS